MKAKKLYRRTVFLMPEGTINTCMDDGGGFVFYSNAKEVVDDLEQRIAELEQFVAKQGYCPKCLRGQAFSDFGKCPDCGVVFDEQFILLWQGGE